MTAWSNLRRVTALAVVVTLAVACGSNEATEQSVGDALGLSGTVLAEPLAKPSVPLTDTRGETYDFAAETDGELAVLFFGYTSCPDVCPVNLSTLATALAELGGEIERTTVAFVGVDTERDTPDALREYLDSFDPRFVGLSGDPAAIESMMTDLDLPPVVIDPPDSEGAYAVGHSSQMLVFTPDGLCHIVYPFGTRTQDWVADLGRLSSIDWTEAAG